MVEAIVRRLRHHSVTRSQSQRDRACGQDEAGIADRGQIGGEVALRMEAGVVAIRATVDEGGRALLDLAGEGGGEIRESVALDELEEAERIPALESLVLHFDFYGRLARIEVTGSAASVLPPAVLDAADRT
jgi:hypothetical protein